MDTQRDNNLDILKSISITFVLLWHLQPIKIILDNSTYILFAIIARILKDLELQLFLTAVPLFYIVSLYLFFQKASFEYFQKRILKLVQLFVFWSIAQNLFYIAIAKELPSLSWDVLISLKPSLPFVGDSVFYFLFNLICLTAIAFIFQQVKIQSVQRIITLVIAIFSLLYFEVTSLGNNSNVPYHWLMNFIIYVAIAFGLANYRDRILKFKFYYLGAYILFSLHDIYLRGYGYFPSIYARVSIVFGALSIFCFVCSLSVKENWLVRITAKYSLGLFALHKYWQCLFFLLVGHFQVSAVTALFGIPLNTILLVQGVVVLFFTVLSVYLLRLTRFRGFVG